MGNSLSSGHGQPEPDGQPSDAVRTVVSFLLFLHLFALMVAIASNARPVSPLRRATRRIPMISSYLQLINMDVAYNFHLTHATEMDTDHFVEVELDWQGRNRTEATRLVLPEPDLWPAIRKRRLRHLARAMASSVGQDDVESILPHAVSRGLLAGHGISSGRHRFRCRRHYLLQMDDPKSIDPSDSDPLHSRRYGTAYEADLIVVDDELLINKASSAAETAPVERSP